MTKAWINNALVEEGAATISVNDRSFRYGDGVFETIPVHEGVPYLWEYHAGRLQGGLEALRIACNVRDLLPHALGLLKSNATSQALLRIHISRGAGSRGYLPASPTPTVVMQVLEQPTPPSEAVTLWLSSYEKISPRALPTQFKLAQGLSSTLARIEAQEHGCFDALQLGEGGCVSESASANIFWKKDGRLYTPALKCGALSGVTRRRVMELSPYPVSEGSFTLAGMEAAEEVFLTNAARGAIAVAKLLPRKIGWDSAALAAEINSLRNNDIKQYSSTFRESLART